MGAQRHFNKGTDMEKKDPLHREKGPYKEKSPSHGKNTCYKALIHNENPTPHMEKKKHKEKRGNTHGQLILSFPGNGERLLLHY